MFQTKATLTGCIGAITLATALLSPTKEVTSADSLVGFASGENVVVRTEQSNKGLLALLLLASVGAIVWTLTGNEEAVPAPISYRPVVGDRSHVPAREPAVPQTIAGETLADFWAQDVAFSVLAQQFGLKTRKELLDKALSEHEGGWLERLLCCPCLLVIGRPGSAKSSFAGALAIVREVLLEHLSETIVGDPNAHLKVKGRVWQAHWSLHGSGDNWKEIDESISAMYQRFADSQGTNYVSSIYDELTAYEGHVNSDRLSGFLPQITSKARASEEYITLVSHSDTLSCLGGKAGQAKLKDDMVQLNLGSKSGKRGKFYPTGKGTLEGLNVDAMNKPLTEAITLPRWFDPALLIHLFPELYPLNRAEGSGDTGDLPGTYKITSDRFPEVAGSAPEVVGKSDGSDAGSGVSYRAAKLLAAQLVQEKIDAHQGFSIALPLILAAAEALSLGKSDTHIIEQVLRRGGRQYEQGKQVLDVIKQTFTSLED